MSITTRFVLASLRRWIAMTGLIAAVIAAPASASAQNTVLEWNDIARRLIVVSSQSPVQQTRLMALVHAAMHNAVNAFTGQHESYGPVPVPPGGISVDAAVIGAARGVLVREPGASVLLATLFSQSLLAHSLSEHDPGIIFGELVADALLQYRGNDGSAIAAFPYVPEDAGEVGVWVPLAGQTSLLPGWGNVTPFVLHRASQFRPGPPPPLTSGKYARDYNEVLLVGSSTSVARSAEQGQIAQFWRASPTALWNPILRHALITRGDDLASTARVMALFYLASADASIACWEAKYVYNFWRPQSAIARGDEDDNDHTVADPSWRPFLDTPPHPDYVSGHASNSGAMAFVLSAMFGDEPGYVIEATSTTAPNFPRHWQSFSEGVEEVIDARVYSGIHFRTADVIGARLGRQVAKFVIKHALRPVKHHK